MIEALAAVAPGRPLREGLDRILQANMGALIVVGDGPEVLAICSGGFLLDAEFSPQRLSELAKMDGVTVLQRAEMVRRIAEEIDGYIVELGVDGRLVLLQLEELMGGVEDDRRLVLKDYIDDPEAESLDNAMETLSAFTTEDLLDLKNV